ncbi:beta-channel forming cytolysin [Macrococcoides canis]|uniref:beta-channel forming cytolysin n=1 Tax=Macrococcoides canis TaxID=1855823 RepID=UPI001AEBC381|nr:beta-channel forming cytolysin [Macrococcus canis]QTQ08179.1 beta-channel forming cytolysin [Macrococcus canis]UTH02518.1 beta-channel forming cytolysin [Macrococcus canis]
MKKTLLSASIVLTLAATPITVHDVRAETNNISIQQIGDGAEVIKRTEDFFNSKYGITQNIQFDFIKDKNFNKDALIIQMQGHIQSRNQYRWYKNPSTKTAQMLWPSKYHIKFKSNDPNTNIVRFLPKNNIESVDVSQTTGYSIGGDFGAGGGLSGGLNSGYNFSKSISYNQQSYKSELKQHSSKYIAWDVTANEFQLDGQRFSAQDKNAFIGWNTYATNPRDFFWEDTELPVLIKSGFNPSFVTTLTKEKNSSDISIFEITYGRTLDITNAWTSSTFSGASYIKSHHQPEVYKERGYTVKYQVNWKNHEVKVIN